jgi:serine/threonine protein kinase
MKKMKTEVLSDQKKKGDSDKNHIIKFFLTFFQLQNGATTKCPSKVIPIDVKNSDHIYELRFRHKGKWYSRRMSISRLGEKSGSKSTCFKVIYDDLIVIKIPPFPIKHFDEYIKNIDAERRIVDALPDIDCISPRVSTILKKIAPFSRDNETEPEKFEQKCIQRLRSFPQFQRHLRIGDSFAFFMDLSKHLFLSEVIQKIHDIGEKLEKEIISQSDSLWDLMVFEDIYGDDTAPVFYSMNDVYMDYNNRLDQMLRQYEMNGSVPMFQRKEWFLRNLAGKPLSSKNADIEPGFAEELNHLIETVFNEYKDAIKDYRTTIKEYVYKRAFKQNKRQLQIIISKLLSVLQKLREKGVAIRDLKPDNLFVIEHTPGALISSAQSTSFSIGLIDFETAVRFKTKYDNKIEQPLLAGTPSYATPSHLFHNELLHETFQDLSRIFHFQDWQACIAIIYSVTTGEHLAEKTGRLLPAIIKLINSPERKTMTLNDLFKRGSHLFWHTALNEFVEKLRVNEDMLRALEIRLPPQIKELFKHELSIEDDRINKIIWKQIDGQSIFKSRKSRKILSESSYQIIGQYKAKCESGLNIPKSKSKIRKLTVKFLTDLEHLKLQSEQLAHTNEILDLPTATLSVYDLLELMFNIVLKAMYLEDWGDLSVYNEPLIDDIDKDDNLYNETVMLEKTLLYD